MNEEILSFERSANKNRIPPSIVHLVFIGFCISSMLFLKKMTMTNAPSKYNISSQALEIEPGALPMCMNILSDFNCANATPSIPIMPLRTFKQSDKLLLLKNTNVVLKKQKVSNHAKTLGIHNP